MALPGATLSLLLLAAASPHAAHAASPHHTARKPIERIAQNTPLADAVAHIANKPLTDDADDAPARPIWSDASGTWQQTGMASWYGGRRWQGRRTFSGARYNEHDLTAAHATLPMGSKVRVVVPQTGRSVVVTINDRPGTRRRIIDLSRAAAAKLGILDRGTATVTLLPD
jgi:rare lipoprotein A (peptidoglycan hydrolase)